MFVLGLRHGFDPDHIAMIDSMTYRSVQVRPDMARWTGTLFALGHGLTVTLIAVVLGTLAGNVPIPAAIRGLLDWLPVALLILVGTCNLRALLSRNDYRVAGWKTRFVPQRLRERSHPLAIFAVGVVFALVFDTATQAAAWGYAATAHSGVAMALLVGLAFTSGMVITDTLDSRLMVRLLRQVARADEALAYRRKVGWIVVTLSYGIASYGIATHFFPGIELGDMTLTVTGFVLFFGLLMAYLWLIRRPGSSRFPLQE
ncbi:DNA repair protein [Actimicrobium antarcticum]|uniref:Nickel/cobalt efflux system n=2 Tax=Actimicrobium antarcticum TaxID=1051899 RepID=A0ABP7TYM9_9BURK